MTRRTEHPRCNRLGGDVRKRTFENKPSRTNRREQIVENKSNSTFKQKPMNTSTWFEDLTGFPEKFPSQVRSKIELDGPRMTSTVNGRTMTWGRLETPSLTELRERTRGRPGAKGNGNLSVREVVGDVQDLHGDPANAGALFQVASQLNLLEMAGPSRTPEDGVGIYQKDHTQGPACAIAAGAGTIYRNYFATVGGERGQTRRRQINCLSAVEDRLRDENTEPWPYRNGYVLPSREQLEEADRALDAMTEAEIDAVRAALRVGIQWDTEVTLSEITPSEVPLSEVSQSEVSLSGAGHLLTQVYASALPVAYSAHPASLWGRLARLVLEGAYEATLRAAALNAERTGNNTAYLTLLGGGAFGNDIGWIIEALRHALSACSHLPLDVVVVSYRQSNPRVQALTGRDW